jgi:N-acetylglucosamine kinase-like BadF-type ATPase
MAQYFLGADVGSSKTRLLIADERGRPVGYGQSGAGNHELVGYAGLSAALRAAAGQALSQAGLQPHQIDGAGFGVSGYDWPSQREPTLDAIAALGLDAPLELVNDAVLGILAGTPDGWGVALVSGSGCNCRGWDASRRREGRVTGGGMWLGEAAGSSDLVAKALQAVVHQWTRRGPSTRLTQAFLDYTGAASPEDLLDGLVNGSLSLDGEAAPLVFQVAQDGDPLALDVIRWAGRELGELACCVIRQMGFEELEFDLVLMGGMFDGGPLLVEPLRQLVLDLAPRARLQRLSAPPVVGAVLLGMEAAGLAPSREVRQALTCLRLPPAEAGPQIGS